MKKISFFISLLLFESILLFSQVSINSTGNSPDNSAMLDVQSTDKGFLTPRLTKAQIEEIPNPTNGLVVYCTSDGYFYAFVERAMTWKQILFGSEIIGAPCPYGNTLIINHIAGSLAPITKTVTYHAVTAVPGEISKCWTTSNLGADHQADSIYDPTEASAGWYWQFNRMQGYKHDGTTLAPGWTITVINDNSDWLTANDPCNIELGINWRLPTYTEWFNIYTAGSWNFLSPWISALKLHMAGYLNRVNGSLYNRGTYGVYWSSTQSQDDNTWGCELIFSNTYGGFIEVSENYKAFGYSVRCIRE
jgi:hypothetical protein